VADETPESMEKSDTHERSEKDDTSIERKEHPDKVRKLI
jgi:hypothetical protein